MVPEVTLNMEECDVICIVLYTYKSNILMHGTHNVDDDTGILTSMTARHGN